MYYVKIPLRYLGDAKDLNVPEEKQQEVWERHVQGLLKDLRSGVIPSWGSKHGRYGIFDNKC